MNITKQQVDALNAVVTVEITKEDYSEKVSKVLTDYRKNANIPGFRKGAVPMSLIEKQYGKAIMADEVNKLLQQKLNDYIVEEKLDILGNPLPKLTNDFSWESDVLKFDFELGLAPEFKVDLTTKNSLTQYKIVADDKMIDGQIERIQKMYGKLIPQDSVTAGDEIKGKFVNEAEEINNSTTISADVFKDKKTEKLFIGKKVGESVTLKTKDLFDDDHKLMDYLKVSHDKVHGLDVEVDFVIESIHSVELAELNTELFDKLFGEGTIKDKKELKAKIKEDAENQLASQADQKFLNDTVEFIVENTKFELPSEFLKKWIQSAGENPIDAEQAEVEYEKSEKGLRYQLIENKLIAEYDLQVKFEELKDFAGGLIKQQMAQFGQLNPTDEEVESIVMRVLSNQDEIKRISDQIMSQKMLNLFKDKVNAKVKEVNYDDFIKTMYGEN